MSLGYLGIWSGLPNSLTLIHGSISHVSVAPGVWKGACSENILFIKISPYLLFLNVDEHHPGFRLFPIFSWMSPGARQGHLQRVRPWLQRRLVCTEPQNRDPKSDPGKGSGVAGQTPSRVFSFIHSSELTHHQELPKRGSGSYRNIFGRYLECP